MLFHCLILFLFCDRMKCEIFLGNILPAFSFFFEKGDFSRSIHFHLERTSSFCASVNFPVISSLSFTFGHVEHCALGLSAIYCSLRSVSLKSVVSQIIWSKSISWLLWKIWKWQSHAKPSVKAWKNTICTQYGCFSLLSQLLWTEQTGWLMRNI